MKNECILIQKIEDIGAAKYLIQEMLCDEIFNDLSKHNPYWKHENEEINNRLRDLKCKFSEILDKLCEVRGILDKDYSV